MTSPRKNGLTAPQDDRTLQLLRRVQNLLQLDRPKEAFDLLNAQESGDPQLKNARGVCLLRMNEPELAMRVFRQLCLQPGGILLRDDVPVLFKTNFASSLLASKRPAGCLEILNEIRAEDDPGVQYLRSLLAAWQAEFSPWQRLLWCCGVEPKHPFVLREPLGELPDLEPTPDAKNRNAASAVQA